MRAQAVKAEAPAARGWDRLELAANAIAPRIVHPEHRRVWRQPQSRARPRLLDDLPLELELVRVVGVLQLAPAADAEMGTFGHHAMRRRLDHTRRRRYRHAALLTPRLRLHDLARQRVVDEPHLALVASDGGATMGRRNGTQYHRRHRSIGSRAGLKPADSTICVAIAKPSPTLSGWWASLPYCTACPPTSRHQRTTVMSGHSVRPRVVFTSSRRPVRALASRMARISSS